MSALNQITLSNIFTDDDILEVLRGWFMGHFDEEPVNLPIEPIFTNALADVKNFPITQRQHDVILNTQDRSAKLDLLSEAIAYEPNGFGDPDNLQQVMDAYHTNQN